MNAKDRVRKHRAKLLEQHRRRIDVPINIAMLDNVQQMTNKPISVVIQDALEWYLDEHRELVAEGRRLIAERERLQSLFAQGSSVALKAQVDDYNRQQTAYNARADRFARPGAP